MGEAMTDPITVSRDELRALIREAVREELAAVGMRTDDADHSEAVREDLRFARRLRLAMDGFASKIGMAVITVIVAGVSLVMWEGWKLVTNAKSAQ
jgi:hypothetical protein